MTNYKILTLFPNFFDSFKSESIIKRAIESNKISIETINFRDFADNKHKSVDDSPYGGGAGMVLTPQPVVDAIKATGGKIIMMSPQGTVLTHDLAMEISKEKNITILCGHYEGFDERIRDYVDMEISIGDYVLTGGEVGAQVLIDATARLISGVIKEDSHEQDSHSKGLLEHPHYTRPESFEDKKVPEILLSGNHKKIEEWREKQSLKNTLVKRPDLLDKANLTDKQIKLLEEIKNEI